MAESEPLSGYKIFDYTSWLTIPSTDYINILKNFPRIDNYDKPEQDGSIFFTLNTTLLNESFESINLNNTDENEMRNILIDKGYIKSDNRVYTEILENEVVGSGKIYNASYIVTEKWANQFFPKNILTNLYIKDSNTLKFKAIDPINTTDTGIYKCGITYNELLDKIIYKPFSANSASFTVSLKEKVKVDITGIVKNTNMTNDSGPIDISGIKINLKSDTNILSTLSVKGDTYFNSSLTVAGSSNIAESLVVNGTTTLSDEVNLSSILSVQGETHLKSSLDVSGTTNLASTLSVKGDTDLGGSLSVSGTTKLAGTLSVSGDMVVRTFNTTSDDRLKHNEIDITDGLSTIMKLKSQIYDKTLEFKEEDYKGELDNYTKESGFIAQEVNVIKELKHLVTEGDDKTPYSINYNGVIPYAVKAIQELKNENDEYKNKVNIIESKLNNLERENLQLKRRLDSSESEFNNLKKK